MTRGRVRTLTGAAGLLALVLSVLGMVLVPADPPAPSATAELVVRWTLEDRRALLVGSLLLAAGLSVGIVFFAGLRTLCARAEGPPGLFATIGWGTILIGAAIALVALGLVQTQTYLVLDSDPATVETVHDAHLLLTDIAGLPASIALVAFGTAMVRTRFPARWLGVLAALAALTQLAGVVALSRHGFFSPSGGAAVLGAIGIMVWVAAVSIVLLTRPRPDEARS